MAPLRWKRGTFEIACRVRGNLESAVERGGKVRLIGATIYALEKSGWVSTCGTWGIDKRDIWTVTHIASGYRASDFGSSKLAHAKRLVEALDKSGPKIWRRLGDLGDVKAIQKWAARNKKKIAKAKATQ